MMRWAIWTRCERRRRWRIQPVVATPRTWRCSWHDNQDGRLRQRRTHSSETPKSAAASARCTSFPRERSRKRDVNQSREGTPIAGSGIRGVDSGRSLEGRLVTNGSEKVTGKYRCLLCIDPGFSNSFLRSPCHRRADGVRAGSKQFRQHRSCSNRYLLANLLLEESPKF